MWRSIFSEFWPELGGRTVNIIITGAFISLLRLLWCKGGSFVFVWGKHVLRGVYGWLNTYLPLLRKVIFNLGWKGEPESHPLPCALEGKRLELLLEQLPLDSHWAWVRPTDSMRRWHPAPSFISLIHPGVASSCQLPPPGQCYGIPHAHPLYVVWPLPHSHS